MAEKFPKLKSKRAGWNKTVQDGLFPKKNKVLLHNYSGDWSAHFTSYRANRTDTFLPDCIHILKVEK